MYASQSQSQETQSSESMQVSSQTSVAESMDTSTSNMDSLFDDDMDSAMLIQDMESWTEYVISKTSYIIRKTLSSSVDFDKY